MSQCAHYLTTILSTPLIKSFWNGNQLRTRNAYDWWTPLQDGEERLRVHVDGGGRVRPGQVDHDQLALPHRALQEPHPASSTGDHHTRCRSLNQMLVKQERLVKTTEIEKTTLDIEEAGVKLRLTIVDTPGYGDGLEGADSWQTCVKWVQVVPKFVPKLSLRVCWVSPKKLTQGMRCQCAGMLTTSLLSILRGKVE